MYFGFSNTPATFQSMMNGILGDLIHIECVIVYLDDILIFGINKKEHRQLVKEVHCCKALSVSGKITTAITPVGDFYPSEATIHTWDKKKMSKND